MRETEVVEGGSVEELQTMPLNMATRYIFTGRTRVVGVLGHAGEEREGRREGEGGWEERREGNS